MLNIIRNSILIIISERYTPHNLISTTNQRVVGVVRDLHGLAINDVAQSERAGNAAVSLGNANTHKLARLRFLHAI